MKISCTSFVLVLGILLNKYLHVNAECCQNKEVKGEDAKAGMYSLVRDSDEVPDFCVDGCIYTKKDDEKPGTYYCFQSGGQMDTKCSMKESSGCSGIEGWVEKYFQKECKMPVNAILDVSADYDLTYNCVLRLDECMVQLTNTSFNLFKGSKKCSGEPMAQSISGKITERCGKSKSEFYLTITEMEDWSILVERQDFKTKCVPLTTRLKPMKTTAFNFKMKPLPFQKVPVLILNFTFDANSMLLPDVKIMQTDLIQCRNVTGITPGDLSWCSKTCSTAAYIKDEIDKDCDCKGILGVDLKFSELSYPNEKNKNGLAKMDGQIMWYYEWTGQSWINLDANTAYLVYSRFLRRNTYDQVCQSKLNITISPPQGSPDTIMKSVPCISPQIPENKLRVSNMNNSQDSTNPQESTPTMLEEEAFKEVLMEMFNEVDGSLVFGNGDMFWLAGCQAWANVANFVSFPNFFTSQDPMETPALCGCLFAVTNGIPESREFTVDQVKECYVEALVAGPAGDQRILSDFAPNASLPEEMETKENESKSSDPKVGYVPFTNINVDDLKPIFQK